MASDTAAKASVYGQRLLDNEYVQENLAQGFESLRAAYRRASKRRVEPTRDEKLRRQLRQAALSIAEGASALREGRTKPKRRRGRKLIVVLLVLGGGTAVLLARKKELRRKLFGGNSDPSRNNQTPTSGSVEVPAP
jgi:hypothetical protein